MRHIFFYLVLYENERCKLLNVVKIITPYVENLPLTDQFCWIMSSKNESILKTLAEYVFKSMAKRNSRSPTD
jgi:hypothetical protein